MPEIKRIHHHNKLAMLAANEGRTTEALLRLSMAHHLAQKLGKPVLTAISNNNMGLVYQMAERMGEAMASFQTALRQVQTELGENHPLARVIRTNRERLKENSMEIAA